MYFKAILHKIYLVTLHHWKRGTHMESWVLHQWKNWSPTGWKMHPPPPQGPNRGLKLAAPLAGPPSPPFPTARLSLDKNWNQTYFSPLLFICLAETNGNRQDTLYDSTHSQNQLLNNSNTSFIYVSSSFSPCAQITGCLLRSTRHFTGQLVRIKPTSC